MKLSAELTGYAENIWRHFPEVFILLGSPDAEEQFDLHLACKRTQRICDTPEGKVIEIILPNRTKAVSPSASQATEWNDEYRESDEESEEEESEDVYGIYSVDEEEEEETARREEEEAARRPAARMRGTRMRTEDYQSSQGTSSPGSDPRTPRVTPGIVARNRGGHGLTRYTSLRQSGPQEVVAASPTQDQKWVPPTRQGPSQLAARRGLKNIPDVMTRGLKPRCGQASLHPDAEVKPQVQLPPNAPSQGDYASEVGDASPGARIQSVATQKRGTLQRGVADLPMAVGGRGMPEGTLASMALTCSSEGNVPVRLPRRSHQSPRGQDPSNLRRVVEDDETESPGALIQNRAAQRRMPAQVVLGQSNPDVFQSFMRLYGSM